jgi:hypothetical protein
VSIYLLSLLKLVASTELPVGLRLLFLATFVLCSFLETTTMTSREEDRRGKGKAIPV